MNFSLKLKERSAFKKTNKDGDVLAALKTFREETREKETWIWKVECLHARMVTAIAEQNLGQRKSGVRGKYVPSLSGVMEFG